MKRCPITYEIIRDEEYYSQRGLRMLAPQLKNLKALSFTVQEQRMEAIARAGKMSIQGVQIKLSARLKIKEESFSLVDQNGQYILKPQSEYYPELPENEAITMTLASMIDIDVPCHGLIYSKDNSMTYFIKRFDRIGHNKKIAIEDFAQLSGLNRQTKYDSSMEKVINIVETYCTFPRIEFVKLFKLIIFNFLIGNEDMHLKNFSLITKDNKITLSPAYDLLNSTIAQSQPSEEMALPLNGKKHNLKKHDFFEYLAKERLKLNSAIIDEIIIEFKNILPEWKKYIEYSFLSKDMKEKYLELLIKRCVQIGINPPFSK